ncbi:MAG: NAD(P)-binding domain-containing protein [Woeseiaceae bacterium]
MRRLLIFLTFLSAGLAHAETVAIIGTGNVGMAIGTEFAALGHTVIYGSRSPASDKTTDLVAKTGGGASAALPAAAAAEADVVVLAVPGMVTETVASGLGNLEGKIIIDATNPLVQAGDPPQFEYGVGTSNGQIVQSMHPDAFVVKAFNTIDWRRMIDPGDPAPVMPIAGDDAGAKAKVAAWVEALGIDTIDIGGIEHSRVTEQIVVLMLNNRFSAAPKYDIEFRKLD